MTTSVIIAPLGATLTTLCLLIAVGAVVASFFSRYWASLVTFIALAIVYVCPQGDLPLATLLFWGGASVIALGIGFLLPPTVSRSGAGVGYISGGALAGAVVGLIISPAATVIGAVVGACGGALAFSRTPAGAPLEFPSRKFVNYLCAKGLPAVVTMSQFGILLALLFIL